MPAALIWLLSCIFPVAPVRALLTTRARCLRKFARGGRATCGAADLAPVWVDHGRIKPTKLRKDSRRELLVRRFTRLTNAFSKKLENLKAALALHFAYYNFVRIHRSLRVTPAMAAGVTERV